MVGAMREIFSEESLRRIDRSFSEQCRRFPELFLAVRERLSEPDRNTAAAMRYLYASMPLSDAASYSFETFLDYALWGVRLRESKQAVRALPEELFFPYVLQHRVNEEEILPCRRLFGEALEKRLRERGVPEAEQELAVKEINYWCAEQGCYRSGDARTLAALSFYRRGYGRCGEESVFAVNAMRAYGIPARQVYVPRWSHCEDNHAWIEVYAGGKWHFTGACEPLEILDRGWFNEAASRAMLVHSRYFAAGLPWESGEGKDGREVLPGEERIGKEGIATMLNQLPRYALTRRIRFRVLDRAGRPLSGAMLSLELLNAAEYAPIAELVTGENGEACFTTGRGSLLVRARFGGEERSALLDVRTEDTLTLRFGEESREEAWRALDFFAPQDAEVNTGGETEAQRVEGKRRLQRCREKLALEKGNYRNPALMEFLRKPCPEERQEILSCLSEKDLTDIEAEVLEECFTEAQPYREGLEREAFIRYVLNPRVEDEILRPHRRVLFHAFSEAERALFRREPEQLWARIDTEIRSFPERERLSVVTPPAACWRSRTGSERSKRILFVAAARSLGIPARLRPSDGAMECWDREAEDFCPIRREERTESWLLFRKKSGEQLQYAQHWTVAREMGGGYRTLRLEDRVWKGDTLELPAVPGSYRIVTENRLPNGNIHAMELLFRLDARQRKPVQLQYRDAELGEMLEHIRLPEFVLETEDGREERASILMAEGKQAFLWLEPGAEPTEHILNELVERTARLSRFSARLHLILQDPGALEDALLLRVRELLPGARIWYDRVREQAERISRRMYVEPDSLPLILVTDEPLIGIYAVSGYNVGSGDLLLRIMEEGQQAFGYEKR